LNKVVCLSNVYEQAYHDSRGEKIERCLSWAKRRDLFHCLEMATGRRVIVLSSPPKAIERRRPRWLPEVETKFSIHRQLFCANWDAPKLRIPLSWIFYAQHVLRHTQSGDLVVIDNYEFIYVVAAWLVRIFRRVTFVLDYEDGKHLIDRSWYGVLSRLAERAGRSLIRGAILAHASLGERLPPSVAKELVPGFITARHPEAPIVGDKVRFLYGGSLDSTRGVDLLLEALAYLPDQGWRLDIAGTGQLTDQVSQFVQSTKWEGKVFFHHAPPTGEYNQLLQACHIGLNCQRESDPISRVTFPSKVFSYLSAGLLVLSTKASAIERICGNACFYYETETPQALAGAMKELICNLSAIRERLDLTEVLRRYSIEGTAERLKHFASGLGIKT
jgi:glycosyltransferase involved in cell wall biosynthesis